MRKECWKLNGKPQQQALNAQQSGGQEGQRDPQQQPPDQDRNAFVLAPSNIGDDIFISDSGASQQICANRELFVEYQELPTPKNINQLCNTAQAIGIGTVRVMAFLNDGWKECLIKGTLHIPGAVNLFSEIIMALKGY